MVESDNRRGRRERDRREHVSGGSLDGRFSWLVGLPRLVDRCGRRDVFSRAWTTSRTTFSMDTS